jgi:hypothetical protein
MRILTPQVLIAVVVSTLTAGCGGGGGGGDDGGGGGGGGAAEYVAQWDLPAGTTALRGLYLAATSQSVYASGSYIGKDFIYLYDTAGTLRKDIRELLADRSTPVEVDQPTGITVGGAFIYVGDFEGSRVLKVDPIRPENDDVSIPFVSTSGWPLGIAVTGNTVFAAVPHVPDEPTIDKRSFVPPSPSPNTYTFSSDEVDLQGVALDSSNDLYAVDANLHRVYKFSADLAPMDDWGGLGDGPGEFDSPWAVAVGPSDTVYVVDANNARVQLFDTDGSYLGEFGSPGTGEGQFTFASAIAVTTEGGEEIIYVGDEQPSQGKTRIQKFRLK